MSSRISLGQGLLLSQVPSILCPVFGVVESFVIWWRHTVPLMSQILGSIECFHMTSRWPYWCSKTMKRRPYWGTKTILWELNSFLMQTLSFVPINLHTCWPREWKRSILLETALHMSDRAYDAEIDHSRKYHNIPSCSLLVTSKFCISIVFSFSWGHFNSQQKLQTMLMKNLGWQTKSIMVCYGIFWSGQFPYCFAYATVLILCVKTCVGLAT